MSLFGSDGGQTTAPWKPAQPYITTGMKTASTLLKNGTGFQAPSFQTWVPMSAQTQGGLSSIWDAAQGGNPLAQQSSGAISGILGGDINQRYGDLYYGQGAYGSGFNQQYQNLSANANNGGVFNQAYGNLYDANGAYGRGFNQQYQNLSANANGAGGFDQRYGDLYANADNTHFSKAVQNQSDQIANDVQRQFSGLGRIGSSADTGALVDQIGRFREQALSDNWNQNIANQRGILDSRAGFWNQNLANQRGILGDQVNNWNQNIANQRGIVGDEANNWYQNIASQRGILGDQVNNWNQNIANQRGLLGDQTNSWLSAIGAAPGAYQQQFLPGQAMGQVGSAYDDLAARQLQSQLDTFNTNQQAPWQRLQAYTGAISGSGGATGFNTQTVQQPSNPFGGALGGALGGASIGSVIPGIGTGIGALGGGLLGLLSGL